MPTMSHVATLPLIEAEKRSAGVVARFLVIALTAFLTVVDLFATQAILPSLTRAYGVSPAAMGSAVNASTLGMAIAGLVVAVFSKKIDQRLGILLSLVVLAVPTALLADAPNLAVFTALRIVQGLCMATAFTLTLAYLGEHPSAVDAATASAAYITGNVASNFVGRFVSAAVTDHFGLASNFYFFASLNLAGAALVCFTVERAPPAHCFGRTMETQLASWALHLCNPRLRAAFGIGFCILFAFIGTFTCERNALDVSRRIRLAQNVPVQDKEFKVASLQLLEDVWIGDRNAVVLRIDGDVKPPAGLDAHGVPQLGQIDMQVTSGGLGMVLPRLERLRPRRPRYATENTNAEKPGREQAPIYDHEIVPSPSEMRDLASGTLACRRCSPENREDFAWIGAVAIVGVGVRVEDEAIAINDVGCRNWQRPFNGRPVFVRNVQTEVSVSGFEFVAELIDQPKRSADLLTDITQHLEGQGVLLGSRQRVIRLLRADGDERCTRRLDVRKDSLICPQFEIAVRTPAAAIEGDHQGSMFQQQADIDKLASDVAQRNGRRAIAGFE
jgi:hypothetical protein